VNQPSKCFLDDTVDARDGDRRALKTRVVANAFGRGQSAENRADGVEFGAGAEGRFAVIGPVTKWTGDR
jgi:hypothetical protein